MCFKCCTIGHLVSKCTSTIWQCLHCRNTNEIQKTSCVKCLNNHPNTQKSKPTTIHINSYLRSNIQSNTTQRSYNTQAIICYTCGRSGHKSPDCYAKTHINGNRFEESDEESSSESEQEEYCVVCYRCGRNGHKSTQCYANTHV